MYNMICTCILSFQKGYFASCYFEYKQTTMKVDVNEHQLTFVDGSLRFCKLKSQERLIQNKTTLFLCPIVWYMYIATFLHESTGHTTHNHCLLHSRSRSGIIL